MKYSQNPIVLVTKFLLEVAALIIYSYWGWSTASGGMKYILSLLIPFLGAVVWAVFGVRGDSRGNGNPPIAVPGLVRLFIELSVFAVAGLMLVNLEEAGYAVFLMAAVVLNYFFSWDRVEFLLKN